MIKYSVIIRTTGQAHEKYRALLDSIDHLQPKPIEVIVVLPEGYCEPDEKLGYETYYYCPKGMVLQRMTGIEKCKTPYALICDDDVTFGADFVKKLYQPIQEGKASFSAGPLYSFLPAKGPKLLLDILMASAYPMAFHKGERYVSILKSSGYSYNRHLDISQGKYYESQSLPWTCFFADIDALKGIRFNDEMWLDRHGHSSLDDQTMFYKAWLNGYKTIVVSDAAYEHLDARTAIRNNKPAVLYSVKFNRVVFWHRFIYSQQSSSFGKIISRIAFSYFITWRRLMECVEIWRKRMTNSDYDMAWKGYKDGWAYVKSKEYAELPSPIIGEKAK